MAPQTNEIEQTELWALASKLVAFDTVSAHSNSEAVDYIANYLQESGFQVRVLTDENDGVKKASLIAWCGPAVPDGLIISGHTDVVPFEGQPGWHYDPLVMQRDGDRIYGRGVADMKVYLAQAFLAARTLRHEKYKRPLVFILTYDEEIAGQGSARLVKILPQRFNEVPLPRLALIGEPSGNDIFTAHKGYAAFDIRVQGKGGHSSIPSSGVNAIEKMADVIHILHDIDLKLQRRANDETRELFPECPYSALNYGTISGGLASNMIADSCVLEMSLRVLPGDSFKEIMAQLRTRLEQEITLPMRRFGPECGAFIEHTIATPPMKSPADHPLARMLSEIMQRPIGKGAAFATDGGQFEALGIHSYVCGPGEIGEAHRPDESLPVDYFLSGQDRLTRLIKQWCIDDHR